MLTSQQAAELVLKRRKARSHIKEYARYIAIEPTPAKHHDLMLDTFQEVIEDKLRRVMIFMPPGCAKALDIETPILTTEGWSCLGDLSVGDQVFDEEGNPCKVTWKSEFYVNRPCYRVITDCGDEIVADQDHEWLVRLCGKRPVFKTKETWELCKTRSKRPMIQRARPLLYPHTDMLPVDPYLLGVWLGDGNSQGMRITSSKEDIGWLRSEIERLGYTTTDQSVETNFGITGIRSLFTGLGLLNGRKKFIPEQYLYHNERLHLLQGLIDSDGTVSKESGQITFTNTNENLALQVRELVRSLGVKAGWSESRATLYGKDCGPVYKVSFYLLGAARMPRKAELTRNQDRTPNTYIDVIRTENRTTCCIEVDSPNSLYLCGKSLTPTHNSTYGSVILPSAYLGVHPDRRVISASYDTGLSTMFGARVRNLISANPEHNDLYPGMNLSPDTKAKGEWNLDGHKGGYYATGVGSAVTGRRGHLAILDDLVKGRQEADSARTMEATWQWLWSDLMTRLIPQTNAVIYITTRWSQQDPAGKLLPEDWDGHSGDVVCKDGMTWRVICFPAQAIDHDILGRKPGEWLWPEWYTPDEWKKIKYMQNEAGTRNWSALYQQNPTPESGTYFKREWFKFYEPEEQPRRLTHYVAADFAVSEDRGDFTEIGVFGVDEQDNLYVAPDLGWWNGKTTSDIWIDRLLDFCKFFKPQTFISEKGVIRNAVEPFLDKRSHERKVYVTKEWLSHIGDKTANARAFQARGASGKVFLPNNEIGQRILVQLLEFPAGKHDDIVDVCGLMGRWLQMSVIPSVEVKKEDIVDRWAKAFERKDSQSDSDWMTA